MSVQETHWEELLTEDEKRADIEAEAARAELIRQADGEGQVD